MNFDSNYLHQYFSEKIQRITPLSLYKFQVFINSSQDVLDRKSLCRPMNKRARNTIIEERVVRRKTTNRLFFLNESEDLVKYVYSYLSTTDIMNHLCINTFTKRVLPSCVLNIRLNAETIYEKQQTMEESIIFKLFERYTNLQTFELIQSSKLSLGKNPKGLCASEIQPMNLGYSRYGDEIVNQLGQVLKWNYGKELKRISILSSMYCTYKSTCIANLSSALANGSCPSLEVLEFGGSSLGDHGMNQLIPVFESGQCPKLQRLDFRHCNIGERGMKLLTESLTTQSKSLPLLHLLLGGNILTNSSAKSIASLIDSGSIYNLQALSLDNNYFTSEGVTEISQALQNTRCPNLRALSFSGNETMESAYEIVDVVASGACRYLFNVHCGNVNRIGLHGIKVFQRMQSNEVASKRLRRATFWAYKLN